MFPEDQKAVVPERSIGKRPRLPLLQSGRSGGDHPSIGGVKNKHDAREFLLLLSHLAKIFLQQKFRVFQLILRAVVFGSLVDFLNRDNLHGLAPEWLPVSWKLRRFFTSHVKKIRSGRRSGAGMRSRIRNALWHFQTVSPDPSTR